MTARTLGVCFVSALLLAGFTPLARAQGTQAPPSPPARLLVTVVDPTGAVLPGAIVSLTSVDPAIRAIETSAAKADEKGLATFDKLTPGRYTIHAEFPGFSPAELKDQRLRTGDNKHAMVLPLKRMEEGVVVGRDARDVATDRTLTFGTVLTREQIQALSDDPDEMRRQLMEMAGPDAIIRVDSFEGQQLPPKAQIKSIRISRDQFAAENHGQFSSIDIVTQPGIGPLRTSVRGSFYDSATDGKNPLVAARGPGQDRSGGGTMGGTLIKNKADVSVSVNGANNWSTPQLYTASTTGTVAQNLSLRVPFIRTDVSGLLNYAVTKDQTIRLGINGGTFTQRNQGVGGVNFAERAWSQESKNWGMRFQEVGPIGRRFVTNTRFQINSTKSDATPFLDAPTTVVQGAFTSGGAQQKGGTESRLFTVQQDLDYVRGLHSWRGGIMIDGGYSATTRSTNYLGTYTFESLAAYQEGRPRSYTRRIGDPSVSYWNVQTALYVQDDIRPRKNLSVSLGLRYETQMRVQDRLNFAPRAGFTWSPLKSGRMSVRASWGIFYEWFPMNTYSQMLQTDGTRQRDVNISNPSYPDPGPLVATSAPTNRFLLEDHRYIPQTNRVSAGVSGSIKRLSMGATYVYGRGSHLLVGQNENAPVNGIRPNPVFANMIRAVGLAANYSHSINGNISVNLSPSNAPGPLPPGMAGGTPKFFVLRRNLFVSSFFSFNRARNNTDGPFSVPATGDLTKEWGSSFGGPWNISGNINSSMIRNLSVNLSVFASAGSYYSIQTGVDTNGDLIFNDRPAGVGRNTMRGTPNVSAGLGINYFVNFGKTAAAGPPPGIMIIEGGRVGGPVVSPITGIPAQPRYRMNFGVSIDNPTNHANYSGYNGVLTSPLFGKPMFASGVRRIRFNVGLSF